MDSSQKSSFLPDKKPQARLLDLRYRVDHQLAEICEYALLAEGAAGVETVDKAELESVVALPTTIDYAADEYLASLPEGAEIVASFHLDRPLQSLAETTAAIVRISPSDTYQAELCSSAPQEVVSLETLLARIAARLDAASRELGGQWDYLGAALLVEENWAESWKQYFHPLPISPRLTVAPSWEMVEPQAGERVIRLDPGSAFGTGEHESTALCLALLDKLFFEAENNGELASLQAVRTLDLGTGSGILAIACGLLGIHQIEAVDIDPHAVSVARENLQENGLGWIPVRQGELADTSGPYDLILANLIARLHLQLAPSYAEKLNPGGLLMLSGIIDSHAREVREAMENAGLELREALLRNEWWTQLWERPRQGNH